MVANKLIYDVREMLKQYIDDSEISDSYILYLYGILRAKYIRQSENDFQKTTSILTTQTLCLALEKVSINECNFNIDCNEIVRTVLSIPKPLDLNIGTSITSVKPTNRIAVPFNFISKEKAIYSMKSPFNKSIYAFLDNDMKIYLLSGSDSLNLLDCLTITGIFEDPLELLSYTNCCNCEEATPCIDYDTIDYPLPAHYIDIIKADILNQLINKLNIPEDKVNDSND